MRVLWLFTMFLAAFCLVIDIATQQYGWAAFDLGLGIFSSWRLQS